MQPRPLLGLTGVVLLVGVPLVIVVALEKMFKDIE
jgi:hypothetical protein